MKYLENLPDKIKWPSNKRVNWALEKAGEKNASIVRYILFKIEGTMRPDPAYDDNQLTTFKELNREHVMPQNWRKAVGWKVDGKNYQEKYDRKEWLHSIGNLTLLNSKVNAEEVKDKVFSAKIKIYKEFSTLKITDDIIWENPDEFQPRKSWDVEKIKKRHNRMCSRFHNVFGRGPHQQHRKSPRRRR